MQSDGAQWRILIVDDEPNVALVLREGLEELCGSEIDTAANGAEAMEYLARSAFDLLITDYRMPGTDGIALATQVRRMYPQTAIIMVTAYGDTTLHEQAAGAGISSVLDKPVELETIRKATITALSGQLAERSSPEHVDGQDAKDAY